MAELGPPACAARAGHRHLQRLPCQPHGPALPHHDPAPGRPLDRRGGRALAPGKRTAARRPPPLSMHAPPPPRVSAPTSTYLNPWPHCQVECSPPGNITIGASGVEVNVRTEMQAVAPPFNTCCPCPVGASRPPGASGHATCLRPPFNTHVCIQNSTHASTDIDLYRPSAGGYIRLALESLAGGGGLAAVELRRSFNVTDLVQRAGGGGLPFLKSLWVGEKVSAGLRQLAVAVMFSAEGTVGRGHTASTLCQLRPCNAAVACPCRTRLGLSPDRHTASCPPPHPPLTPYRMARLQWRAPASRP